MISTIIRREDVRKIDLKANLVNAFIILQYESNERVFVCDNDGLYDSRFRLDDKVHLNEHGILVFASNLKYAIAGACGVQVVEKKSEYRYRQRNNGHGNRFRDRNRRQGNGYWGR